MPTKVLIACLICLFHSNALLAQPEARDGYEVAWFDEFDAAELNQKRWTAIDKKVPTNNSRQDYLPGQVSIHDGKLIITTADEPSRGLPFRSGLVISNSKQKYGRWDVRAKLPATTGNWPAIWLLPEARWPSEGEIDIMENRGDHPTIVSSAFHYGTNPPYKHHHWSDDYRAKAGGKDVNFQAGWHVYSCEWDPKQIRFYVDDVLHWTLRDEYVDGFLTKHIGPMKLLINNAVGGDFLKNPDETTVWPQTFEIDYVHVYARTEEAIKNLQAEAENKQPAEIRVMSFNIRLGSAKDGDNHWDKRKDLLAETIRDFDPHILGVQETFDFQAKFILKQVRGYQYVGRSRDRGRSSGEQSGIFFRTERFDKLGEGHFWLSETPDQPGSQGWDSAYPRMATWVQLWDRLDRNSFYVINTHFDHKGETARFKGAKLIRNFMARLPTGSNVIVTGDFNAGENSAPYQVLFNKDDDQTKLTDSFRSHVPSSSVNEGTFNGFEGTDTGKRIDWIGATDKFQVESAAIIKSSAEGRFPSDHFPVTAVLKLNVSESSSKLDQENEKNRLQTDAADAVEPKQ